MSNNTSHLAEFTRTQLQRGGVAYEAYCAQLDWKAFNGQPLPKWSELCANPERAGIIAGWIKAGDVLTAVAPVLSEDGCHLLQNLPSNQAPARNATFFFVPVRAETPGTVWNCDAEVLQGILENQVTKNALSKPLMVFLDRDVVNAHIIAKQRSDIVLIQSCHKVGTYWVTVGASPSLTITRVPGGVFVHASGIHVEHIDDAQLQARWESA